MGNDIKKVGAVKAPVAVGKALVKDAVKQVEQAPDVAALQAARDAYAKAKATLAEIKKTVKVSSNTDIVLEVTVTKHENGVIVGTTTQYVRPRSATEAGLLESAILRHTVRKDGKVWDSMPPIDSNPKPTPPSAKAAKDTEAAS